MPIVVPIGDLGDYIQVIKAGILEIADMEIIHIRSSTLEQIIKSVVQEDVDIIVVSFIGGVHISLE